MPSKILEILRPPFRASVSFQTHEGSRLFCLCELANFLFQRLVKSAFDIIQPIKFGQTLYEDTQGKHVIFISRQCTLCDIPRLIMMNRTLFQTTTFVGFQIQFRLQKIYGNHHARIFLEFRRHSRRSRQL